MIKNMIDKERPLIDMKVFPDYETVREIINIFAQRYNFLSVTSIGETVLGKSIYMVDIGSHEAETEVFYVGSHHGTEWITTLVLLRFINEYCEYYKNSSVAFGINIRKLFQNRCIHIVPCLNADGVDIHLNGVDEKCVLYDRLIKMSNGDFSKWQSNARGVDLNHNYNAGFYEYKLLESTKGIEAGPTRYSGVAPESESEVGAVANYLRFNEKIKAVITLHSQGETIYYTSDGKCPDGSYAVAKQMELLTGYSLDEPKGLSSYGGLTDWYIKEIGKPSFTVECGLGENPLPLSDFYKIYSDLRRMLFSFPLLI